MAGSIKRYTPEDLAYALEACRNGATVPRAAALYKIPERSLRRKYELWKAGYVAKKPGPAPVLGGDTERDIRDWIVGMQRSGYPATRELIINKAKEIFREMYGPTRAAGTVGRGWYDRFRGRFPELTTRCAQVISRVREVVTEDSATAFFGRCARAMIQHNIQADRCFNVDETAFVRSGKSRKAVVLKGSRNVWAKGIEASFHLTVVACSAASGLVVPPLFILPGKRLDRDLLDDADYFGVKVTTADAGFMNTTVFEFWIAHFALSVPTPIRRPLMLVLDGVASHMSQTIDDAAARHGVILVQLPPNTSHLFQPLDVGVFKAVKSAMREDIEKLMAHTGHPNITKKEAVTIATAVWKKGADKMAKNAVSGFRASGIFPLSKVAMIGRVKLFEGNGIKKDEPAVQWLKARKVVREEILTLPPEEEKKRKRRKTVDAKRRLLSSDDLHNEP